MSRKNKQQQKKQSPTKFKLPDENNNDLEEDDEDDPPLTKSTLDQLLKKHFSQIQKGLDDTISKLQANLDSVSLIADNAIKLAEKLEKELSRCQSSIKELAKENSELKKQLNTNTKNIKQIEERIEERTNRQLRKTLVFKGIEEKLPEPPEPTDALDPSADTTNRSANSTSAKETWAETEEILAQHIADICEIEVEEATKMIDRCHLSAPNPNYKGKNPRPIFAAFYCWKESQYVLDEFRKNNIANKDSKVSCENKYGPLTTRRRNLALAERKSLKDKGEIMNGYIAFPAKLMVRTTPRSKYFMIKDFTTTQIEFGKRD